MQKSKKFNKKQSVRFHLVPGTDEKGNPTVIYEPADPVKSKISEKERKKIINQISGYQIQIDGKAVDQSDLPAFVLEQIRGRADLVFNQKNGMEMGEEEDIEDMDDMEQQWEEEQGQEIPESQYMDAQVLEPEQTNTQIKKNIQIDGTTYTLTESQLKLLDQVLPQNYENYKIEGVQFKKYNEDGINIDDKKLLQAYKRYVTDPNQKRAVVDSYEYRPELPVDIVDNDLQGEVLKGDLKELEDALQYEGEDGAYEEIQDDFFAKLIGGETQSKNIKKQESKGEGFKKKKSQHQPVQTKNIQIKPETKVPETQKNLKKIQKQKLQSKLDGLDDGEDYDDQQQYEDDDEDYEDEEDGQYDEQEITDEMLDKALEEFDRKKQVAKDYEQEDVEVKRIPGTGVPVDVKGMSLINFIESREGCIGKDGQLDWRTLTKKQKKEYMKNKKIRQVFQQIRQREVQQKLKDKQNVTAQQLHLKQYIKHIPYSQDHVMQEAIKRDQQEVINIDNVQNQQDDFETDSEENDIISYRAKTSIISSNLATVEQGERKRKKKTIQENSKEQAEKSKVQMKNIEKVKVVPERREKNETKQQRKQRKQKLKQMKKQKKEQRKQFNEMFEGERKKIIKHGDNNTNNPLYKVPYVKIA